MPTPEPKWKLEGVVDDFQCDCCGRRGFKRLVAMMPLDDGNEAGTADETVYYSPSCASLALGWKQTKVIDTARTAQSKRDRNDSYARWVISIYAPVEFAPADVQAHAYYGRSPRPWDEAEAVKGVAKRLAWARAMLADTTVVPARPSRIEDFRRYAVLFTSGGQVCRVEPVPEEEAGRQEQAAMMKHRARRIRGRALVVAALDSEAAGAVAYTSEPIREWNLRAWQAANP
ncbi:hypothetical protein ACF07T_39950 [Streptomyces sp. NPDC015184]|uniref:hypothetical protein n=1 Tax=Streptomyces sp. NPDC015184 TaxID=3364946 RepID=UPI0036F8D6F6